MEQKILVSPVKRYAPPKYPSLDEAGRDPELLRKLPPRWRNNAKVIAAVGMLGAMTLTSCVGLGGHRLNVAPIFEHGDGAGSLGCLSVTPYVYLDEAEALEIIKTVAESAGLNFDASPPGNVATKNKVRSLQPWNNNAYSINYYVGKRTIRYQRFKYGIEIECFDIIKYGEGEVGLDLYDAEKRVAVAYIPERAAMAGSYASVIPYNQRALAEMTTEDFAKQRGGFAVGVFYEPGLENSEALSRLFEESWANRDEIYEAYKDVAYDSPEEEEMRAKLRTLGEELQNNKQKISKELLRAQVRDFIEWLQGQGII